MLKRIMPYLTRLISSNSVLGLRRHYFEIKRRIKGEAHRVDIFLRINDPYSYLLVQVIGQFHARFNIEVRYHTVLNLSDTMYPEKKLWYQYAVIDAGRLANMYQLAFPPQIPANDPSIIEWSTAELLRAEINASRNESLTNHLEQIHEIFTAYWWQKELKQQESRHKKTGEESLSAPPIAQLLSHNEKSLLQKKHYSSAMLFYGGEWYWGIDRLDHLERRLNGLGLNKEKIPRVEFDRSYARFLQYLPATTLANKQSAKTVTFYWSARSPYSYVALVRLVRLTQRYRIRLTIKAVMPMVMRGMAVPKMKKMYIFHDTKREAEKLGVRYGFVADPLGKSVERCYALWAFAEDQGLLVKYLLSYARAVNSQGIDASSDRGMKRIVERCGLDWIVAKSYLENQSWRQQVQANVSEMLELGCWGVPSFRYGDQVFWGQDRIGMLEQLIADDIQQG